MKLSNYLSLLCVSLFLLSCAQNKKVSKVSQSKNDSLKEESLMRYSQERLESLSSGNPSHLLASAKCHSRSISDGLDELKKKIRQDKKNPHYWNAIGNCYYLKGNRNKAYFYYQHALQFNQHMPSVHNNLGLLYLDKGHLIEAKEHFKKAIKHGSKLKTPHYNLAQVYLHYAQADLAIKELMFLFKGTGKKDPEVLGALGLAHLLKKDHIKAIHYFKQLSPEELRRQDFGTHYATALYLNGKVKLAKDVLSDADKSIHNDFKISNGHLEEAIEKKLEELEDKEG